MNEDQYRLEWLANEALQIARSVSKGVYAVTIHHKLSGEGAVKVVATRGLGSNYHIALRDAVDSARAKL